MTDDNNVRVKVLQMMLRVMRIDYGRNQYQHGAAVKGKLTGERLRDLLVHNDPDLHASGSSSLQHAIQTIRLIKRWWASEVELRTQPP